MPKYGKLIRQINFVRVNRTTVIEYVTKILAMEINIQDFALNQNQSDLEQSLFNKDNLAWLAVHTDKGNFDEKSMFV